ncbi:MAG TPA: hypothetical protein VL225_05455 [Vicinamibacterales bacterium]|nr:hypothetical protein [Vicinamibacterales bacterium]
MTMKLVSARCSIEWTVTIPEWLRPEAARASRRSWPPSPVESASTLIATTRSSWVSRARYTVPMPPRPRIASIS